MQDVWDVVPIFFLSSQLTFCMLSNHNYKSQINVEMYLFKKRSFSIWVYILHNFTGAWQNGCEGFFNVNRDDMVYQNRQGSWDRTLKRGFIINDKYFRWHDILKKVIIIIINIVLKWTSLVKYRLHYLLRLTHLMPFFVSPSVLEMCCSKGVIKGVNLTHAYSDIL